MKRKDLTKLSPAERLSLVLRVNKNTRTTTTQADRDKNANIAGRSVYLGRTL